METSVEVEKLAHVVYIKGFVRGIFPTLFETLFNRYPDTMDPRLLGLAMMTGYVPQCSNCGVKIPRSVNYYPKRGQKLIKKVFGGSNEF